ncbi:MAG TPA: RNA polymerase factor sigma-54, partial [Methylophaga sp.]|nr:RNA polymerase factor sigma-54 [Methylophaga sp.]
MTPQLQQAIRLLQLSSLELQVEIQEALESNPLLEVEEDYDYDAQEAGNRTNNDDSREISQLENRDIPEDLPVDSQWEDIF